MHVRVEKTRNFKTTLIDSLRVWAAVECSVEDVGVLCLREIE